MKRQIRENREDLQYIQPGFCYLSLHILILKKNFHFFRLFMANFILGSSRSILHPHIVRIPDKVLGKTQYSCRISWLDYRIYCLYLFYATVSFSIAVYNFPDNYFFVPLNYTNRRFQQHSQICCKYLFYHSLLTVMTVVVVITLF